MCHVTSPVSSNEHSCGVCNEHPGGFSGLCDGLEMSPLMGPVMSSVTGSSDEPCDGSSDSP